MAARDSRQWADQEEAVPSAGWRTVYGALEVSADTHDNGEKYK